MFNFAYFPTLETPRLRLDAIADDDLQALYDLYSDETVTQYNDIQTFRSLEDARWLLRFIDKRFVDKVGVRWAVRLADTPCKLIGTAGFNVWMRSERYADIGYDLLPYYWNRGLTSEAVDGIVEFGFKEMMLNRVEAQVEVHNAASVRVLTKCGFAREGVLRQRAIWNGQFHDMTMWSLLREDWKTW
jgi:[ribosomal protein S5]-alanine N-acetyltransferase